MFGPSRRLSSLQKYAIALASVALAAALRWLIGPLIGNRFPFLLQFIALLWSARYLGFGPALAGLALGTSPMVIGAEFLVRAPRDSGWLFWVATAVVYGVCVFVLWVLDRQRRMAERLETEVEQREREQVLSAQLRAIVDSSEDAIISKNMKGEILSWNYGAEQIYGYTSAEAIGRPITLLVPQDRQGEETDIIERIRHGGRMKHFETVRVRKDGTPLDVSMTVSPIYDGRGEIVGVSHISRDITEAKRIQEQLRQTQKIESLGVMAGGLAHDFNNLLTGILGNASLALEDLPQGAPTRVYIEEVLSGSERAALLIRQMLAYAGKGRFVVARLNLSHQVAEIIPLLRHSVPSSVRLDLQLMPGLPAVEADPGQMQQLIMNLVINAVEAIGSGPGAVTIATFARETEAEHQVILEVRDNGCGMDEATRARIFDPFFSTKFTGRGLGLSAVLGIVRGHRGFISLESAPAKGSVFTIVLPSAPAGEVAAPLEPRVELRGYGHLLVVDDEELVRTMARFTLERCGYTVELASGGEAALGLFSERPRDFDAVLLDLTMPGMDGEETLARLRSIDPAVRIILSSGFGESEALRRFNNSQLAGFLPKPYTAALLARKVKQALRRDVNGAG